MWQENFAFSNRMSVVVVRACSQFQSAAQIHICNRKEVISLQLHINGDGDSFEFRLLLRWRPLRSLLVAVGALLAAPVITQLGALIGWW